MFRKISVYDPFTPQLKEAMFTEVNPGGSLYREMSFYGRLDVDKQVNVAFQGHPQWAALVPKKHALMLKPVNQDYFVIYGCLNYQIGRLLSIDLKNAAKLLKGSFRVFKDVVVAQSEPLN